jgi:amidase
MFDALRATADDLRQLLRDDKISSVQIVAHYWAQIDLYNPKLNAFISLAPREKVARAAASLDEERRHGRVRSPLHGIPIVLKVIAQPHFLSSCSSKEEEKMKMNYNNTFGMLTCT